MDEKFITKEELVEFIKNSLTINFGTTRESYRDYMYVSISLCGEEICRATNYEMEIEK